MSKAIEPRLPSGFRDFDPTQAAARRRVLQIIEEQYLLMGSTPLETPAVEYEDVLIGAEDYSKQLYRVVRRGTEDGEAEEKNPLALRFDLTVPLARYIAAHQDLPMPFIRHQVGQVWRGERKQQGRYHEFTQFDLDIVGVSSLVADAQIIATMCNVMIALGIQKFKVKVGHRGLLDGLFDGMNVSAEDKMFFLRELDKVDPENPESIKDKFIEKGIKKEVVSNIFELLFGPSLKMFDISNFKGFEKKFEAKVNESQAQLQRLVANVKELGIDVDKWLSASPSIVRGLGYYTGPVWETVLLDAPEFGSVYSGGRYDDLLERCKKPKVAESSSW
jgi:histidyl-tRNA synthetase